jgi:hypothetical protein
VEPRKEEEEEEEEEEEGPYILNTLFSNTFDLCSSLSVRDQVSHPYKTQAKIMNFYMLIYCF